MKSIIKKVAVIAVTAIFALGMAGCNPNVEVHEHTNSDEWSFDGEYHWHAATCEHTEAVAGREPHSFGEWSEGKRSCSVCDYEQICGHTWDEGVVTKPATEFAKGEIQYTCDVCGETEIKIIPIWYESPVDFVTGEAATANSEYVLFGVFPKTVLPLDSTVTVDETDSVEMGANTYYRGSDGEYYAKILENAYGSGKEYKYENGEQSKKKDAGSYRYFKVEPIKWKVLTKDYDGSNNALLLAEDILTANVPYYTYNNYTFTRTVGTDTGIYPNNYKYSQIRAYLNGLDYYYDKSSTSTEKRTDYTNKGFLQAAFTATAQSKIVTTTVDNSGESTTDATGSLTKADGSDLSYPTDYTCADTADKIFLLSEKEVTTTAYGFAAYNSSGIGNARIRFPTDYAKANYAFQSPIDGYGGFWWLRSPLCYFTYSARYVYHGGPADVGDAIKRIFSGVVPALSISLQ